MSVVLANFAFVGSDTPPVVTVISAGAPKVSAVSGKNAITVTFTVSEDFRAYEVRVVPGSTSLHTAGTLAASGAGTGLGGDVQSVTVSEAALAAAGAAEGNNMVKIFAQDLAGNWSS